MCSVLRYITGYKTKQAGTRLNTLNSAILEFKAYHGMQVAGCNVAEGYGSRDLDSNSKKYNAGPQT